MEKPNIYQPSEVELEILQILWEHQPTTVRFVHDKICERREVGYTTILTFLQRMTEKKMVERQKEGKVHYYTAVPKKTEVQQSLFKKFVKATYNGSAMNMVMHALGQQEVSSEELDHLQQWLEAQKTKGNE